MCKFIGKSNERILCKLRKSEILRLCSIVHVAMETMKLSSVHFSLAKFQLVSSNLSLAVIWQMTHNHKLPKLCSATLRLSWNKNKVFSDIILLPFFLVSNPQNRKTILVFRVSLIRFNLLADTTLGYFFHVLKNKL